MKKIKKSSNNPLETTKVTVTLEFLNSDIDDFQKLLDRQKGKISFEEYIQEATERRKSGELSYLRLSGMIDE